MYGENGTTPYTVGEYGIATVENCMKVQQKLKYLATTMVGLPLLAIYQGETIVYKDTCTSMFYTVLFTTMGWQEAT